ncbi:MAG: glycosyltransferase family 39 protein [Lentisphaeria bacterium]|nr:MAG: glycosyltransferase family 39 protein [Lentisphaeria bacterium]
MECRFRRDRKIFLDYCNLPQPGLYFLKFYFFQPVTWCHCNVSLLVRLACDSRESPGPATQRLHTPAASDRSDSLFRLLAVPDHSISSKKSGDAVWKWSFLRYYAVSGIWYPDTPDHHQGRWGLNLPVYALMKLFGTSWWVYYIYPLLTALGCAILAYWIAAKLRSKAAGVATFLLICFFPHTVRESTQFLPMMPATFYMLGAIVLLLRHLKTGALMPLFWSGLLAGISYGCKFTSLYWAAAFGLYLLLYPVEKREYFRVWKFHVGPAAFCFSAGLLLVLVLETVLLDAFFGVTGGRVEVILGSHLSHRVSPEYLGIGGYLLSFFRPLEFSGKYFQSGPAILLFCGVLLMAILQLKKGCPPADACWRSAS